MIIKLENVTKYISLFGIVLGSLLVAFLSNLFWGLDVQWGLLASLIVLSWFSIYDLIENLSFSIEENEESEESTELPSEVTEGDNDDG